MTTTQEAPAVEAAEPPPYRWRWIGLAVVLFAELMDLLDSTILSVAAPAIRGELGGSYGQLQWYGAAYTLAFAMLLITGARLGDIYGRRRMFLIGTVAFTSMSMLCGLAQSPEMLIGTRALQGLAAAVMVPQGFGLLREMFPPKEIGAAFGIFGPVLGLGVVGAPILGGVLVDADLFGSHWRSIFFVNVPMGVLAFVLAWWILPESPKRERTVTLDLVGTVLLSAAMVLLVHPLVQGREAGWPAYTFVELAGGAVMLAVFALYEVRRARSGRDPLIELSLFRNRTFGASLVVGLLFFGAMIAFFLVLSLYLQLGLGWTATNTAYAMIPWSLSCAVGAGLSGGLLAPKYGRTVLHSALLITMVGTAGLWFTVEQFTVTGWALAPAMAVTGIGSGLFMAPFFDIALAGVADHETGSASGTLNATQQLGAAAGTAILGTVFFSFAGDRMAAGADQAFSHAISNSLPVFIGVAAVTWLTAFLLPKKARA
jgi:EmrB/QacA subfamily drug resistance transporter